jgi:hypothetical protein
MTCRCPMCGTKNTHYNFGARNLYHRFDIGTDEDGIRNNEEKKRMQRRLRRHLNNPNNW